MRKRWVNSLALKTIKRHYYVIPTNSGSLVKIHGRISDIDDRIQEEIATLSSADLENTAAYPRRYFILKYDGVLSAPNDFEGCDGGLDAVACPVNADQFVDREPPPTADKLIALFCPPDRVEAVLGDMEQSYNLLRDRHGKRFARVWYWWTAVRSVVAFFLGLLGELVSKKLISGT